MKNKGVVTLLAINLFITGACSSDKITDNSSTTEIYKYINESGVEVALVGEANENFDITDSLVLQNGEFHECSFGYPDMNAGAEPSFPYKEGEIGTTITYTPLKIYFNKTTRMVYYANKPNSRNPFFTSNSYKTTAREEKGKKGHIRTIRTYTYTFTAEDYQNALKAQDNIGKL